MTKKWLNSLFRVICILAAIACVVVAVIFFKKHKAVDEGYERQAIEESLASGYVDFLRAYAQELDAEQKSHDETGEEMSHGETEEKSHDETEQAATLVTRAAGEDKIRMGGFEEGKSHDETPETGIIRDDLYFERNGICYTPDYAQGDLQFVIYIPDLGINRGVYGGDQEAIYKDLQWYWMACIGQPDLQIGQTHMVVLAHNHTAQNLSFNRLPDAKEGMKIYCYAKSGVYEYAVTDVTIMSRSTVDNISYNMSTSKDMLYLATCGRDYYIIDGQNSRYQDVVVVCQLVNRSDLTEVGEEIWDAAASWTK